LHRYDWDDVKYILAVVDHGSVSAAARALKVNHATVLRRIAMFEERFGIHLFDKSLKGYILPAENQLLIEIMRGVESAALAVERQIAGDGDTLRGHVRITSTDTFCHHVLPPLMTTLHEKFPALALEVVCTNAHLDLARMEADITIRPAFSLANHLVGEQAGTLGFGCFAAKGSREEWIGLTGALQSSAPAKWMEENLDGTDPCFCVDSFLTAMALARAGNGWALLPSILGDTCDGLEKIEKGPIDMAVPVWIASHRDLAQVPRIAAVRSELTKQLSNICQL
jgi:DNA-binding transcriptional LysR family regulator